MLAKEKKSLQKDEEQKDGTELQYSCVSWRVTDTEYCMCS